MSGSTYVFLPLDRPGASFVWDPNVGDFVEVANVDSPPWDTRRHEHLQMPVDFGIDRRCPKEGCARPKPFENKEGRLECWWCGFVGGYHDFPLRDR